MGCVGSKTVLRHAADDQSTTPMNNPIIQGAERGPALSISRCLDSLGESCSIEQLQTALEAEGLPFDESRLKVAVHAFQKTESINDGGDTVVKLLCADLNQRGFAHFIGRTAPKGIFPGQCVSTKGVVGAITGISKSGLFSVAIPGHFSKMSGALLQKHEGVEVMHGVPAKDLVVCTNLDKTKQSTQTNYLQALAERVGPNPRSDKMWRDQVPMAMKRDWAERNKPQLVGDNKAISTPPWAASFETYCSYGAHKPTIEQISRAGRWNSEDAGVISFCLQYAQVLAASVDDSDDCYGALLHKYYGLMAQRAMADSRQGPTNRRFRSEAAKVRISDNVDACKHSPHCLKMFPW
jgi:hypothetical protein